MIPCRLKKAEEKSETSSVPVYELYKVDFDTFKQIFVLCSTWGRVELSDQLILRMFRYILYSFIFTTLSINFAYITV